MKGKYLITTDNWFVAPDGHSYLAVWGDCETVTAEEALGLVPNRNSANWFVRVSNNGEEVLLAGCQIHYAVSCKEAPNNKPTEQNFDDKGKVVRDTKIYIPGKYPVCPDDNQKSHIEVIRTNEHTIYKRKNGSSDYDFIKEWLAEYPNFVSQIASHKDRDYYMLMLGEFYRNQNSQYILYFKFCRSELGMRLLETNIRRRILRFELIGN